VHESKRLGPGRLDEWIFPDAMPGVVDKTFGLECPHKITGEILQPNHSVTFLHGRDIHAVNSHDSPRHHDAAKLLDDKLKMLEKFFIIPAIPDVTI
jgi:hypothetical protein